MRKASDRRSMRRVGATVSACVALGYAAAVGCASSSGGAPGEPEAALYDGLPTVTATNDTAVVGAGGAHVLFANDVVLDVPAGALDSDVTLEVRSAATPSSMDGLGDPVAPALQLSPDGLPLDLPARLQLPMPSVPIDDLMAVSTVSADDEPPEDVPGADDLDVAVPALEDTELSLGANGSLETTLWHFSRHAVFRRPNVAIESLKACTTAPARGLSLQIEQVLEQLASQPLVRLADPRALSSDPLGAPFFQAGIAQAIVETLDDSPANRTKYPFRVMSGWRSLAQQYILAHCGNGNKTAAPGRSRHMNGTAVDLKGKYGNAKACGAALRRSDTVATVLARAHPVWGAFLEEHGFLWYGTEVGRVAVCADPPHFDNAANPATELRPTAIKAFQRLWNNNNPCDMISEDGAYVEGGETEARLKKSPSGGFPPAHVTTPWIPSAEGVLGGGCPNGDDKSAKRCCPFGPDMFFCSIRCEAASVDGTAPGRPI